MEILYLKLGQNTEGNLEYLLHLSDDGGLTI